MADPIGYGPGRALKMLHFTGEESQWELWEERFTAYLRQKKLQNIIDPTHRGAVDVNKNADVYSELVQFLDDRSLGLIMRDAKNDGKKSMAILREHYAGTGKPRMIALYSQLCSLTKQSEEDITSYLLRAENIVASLKNSGANIDDAFVIAVVLKGLPAEFHTFAVITAQNEREMTFQEFKASLRSFEDSHKTTTLDSDRVMKARVQLQQNNNGRNQSHDERHDGRQNRNRNQSQSGRILCYGCGNEGHKSNSRECPLKQNKWCNICRSPSHQESQCRRRSSNVSAQDTMNIARVEEMQNEFHSFHFKLSENDTDSENDDSFLVDSGCTRHVSRDETLFLNFDPDFKPAEHTCELADGTKLKAMAEKRGTAIVYFKSKQGDISEIVLHEVLYIPTFPANLFSVKAAVKFSSCSVYFSPSRDELITQDGTTFEITSHGDLYFLKSYRGTDTTTRVNAVRSLETWHSILGHCNVGDIMRLEPLVDGMKIKQEKQDFICEPCILGKQTKTFNHEISSRATKPLEFVSTDLCGPLTPISYDGFEYVISFTDNFSGYIFLYFIRKKSDAARALQKFLADVSPIGNVRNLLNLVPEATILKMRSDNGGEFMGAEFKNILIENKIKHEQCAPYSPHQNGIAERGWRTLFESARSSLIESKLPKFMWPYALMNAAHVRNRCFQKRTQQTPYFMLTGRKPDFGSLHIFGTICYSYEEEKKKLDDRSKRGIFVGYDRESPAYLIYHNDSQRVKRSRCVKFTDLFEMKNDTRELPNITASPSLQTDLFQSTDTEASASADTSRPSRQKNPPPYLDDFVCSANNGFAGFSGDRFFMLSSTSSVPSSYIAAIKSPEADQWQQAMDDEINSLEENETYDLVNLPEGKSLVKGRWVYNLKDGPNGVEIFKARYVAKGFTQVQGLDYFETFSPTVKMSSVRAVMQIAAEYGLSISQMDVKTAFLNAPIDCEIYVEQPRGYEKPGGLVCRLKKSLYGLKQSGRNWNNTLHDFLIQNEFKQSSVDPCVYFRQRDNFFQAIIVVWVDDLIIGAKNDELKNEIKDMLKSRFRMKDLGDLTYFLGIEFSRASNGLSIKMSQAHYTQKLLAKYGMIDSRSRSTPCEVKPEIINGDPHPMNFKYREIVGSLIYLMTCTRPDISWTVTRLSQKLESPGPVEWVMLKHVLRYLKGSMDYGLLYTKTAHGISLVGYSDSDWASCADDRRSTTGYYFCLNAAGPPVSWKSRKQPTVALSSCEAEYMAFTDCVQEAMFLQMMLSEVISVPTPIPIHGDNQGAIALVKNPIISNRSKHIDTKHHFIREKFSAKVIDISYVNTNDNVADVFTKPVTKPKLIRFRGMLFGEMDLCTTTE